MASIYRRNSSYAVIYYCTNDNGVRKQKWESNKTEEQARRRKHEVENPFLLPELPMSIITVNDALDIQHGGKLCVAEPSVHFAIDRNHAYKGTDGAAHRGIVSKIGGGQKIVSTDLQKYVAEST